MASLCEIVALDDVYELLKRDLLARGLRSKWAVITKDGLVGVRATFFDAHHLAVHTLGTRAAYLVRRIGRNAPPRREQPRFRADRVALANARRRARES